MDSLTHGLTGAGLGLLLAASLPEPNVGIFTTALIASQLPDADVLLSGRNKLSYLKNHRGWSHSLLLAPFYALLLATIVKLSLPEAVFSSLFLAGLLSLFLHLFLDMLNAYGTKLLWPLSGKRIALDILAIIDPLLLAFFGTGLGLYYFSGNNLFIYFLFPLLGIYLVAKLLFRHYSKGNLALFLNNDQDLCVLPSLILGKKHPFIAKKEKGFVLGSVSWRGEVEIKEELISKTAPGFLEKSKELEEIQVFLDFARFPWASEIEEDGKRTLRWLDLRYRLGRKERFVMDINTELLE